MKLFSGSQLEPFEAVVSALSAADNASFFRELAFSRLAIDFALARMMRTVFRGGLLASSAGSNSIFRLAVNGLHLVLVNVQFPMRS